MFLGGLVRRICDRAYRRQLDADEEPEGTLFSSGLIAGAAILGVLAAMQGMLPGYDDSTGLVPGLAFLAELPFGAANGDSVIAQLFGVIVLGVLGWLMFRSARSPGGSSR